MKELSKVLAISPNPEPSGHYVILIRQPDGKEIEAAIDVPAAQTIVGILQKALIQWADKTVQNMKFPIFDVHRIDIAHQGAETQLLAATAQMGSVVLRMSRETREMMKHELDRISTLDPPTKAAN
jgi:hypothetical protein